jgi:small-conductance mechanosensitive channel
MVSGVPEAEVPALGFGTLVSAAAALVVAYVVVRATTYALTLVSERSVERRIAVKMFVPLTKFVVYTGALYYILGPVLELSSSQILAFSGVLGAVLGLGLQDLFADLVGGLVILIDRPYRIGDKVEMDGSYGEVTDIGVRSTKLRTPDDSLVSVPNYLLFTSPVSNANDGAPEMMVVVEFHVAPDADTDRAASIVRDALRTSRYVYLSDDRGVVVRTDDSAGYTTLRGKAYVNDVRNEKAFGSEVTERVLGAFDEEGVERPSPVVSALDRRQEY